MNYNPKIILAFWKSCGLPPAVAEHVFCDGRKWRFDFAFPNVINHQDTKSPRKSISKKLGVLGDLVVQPTCGGLAVEVQGGIWTRGRHTRGAALKLEWEKLNTAAILGWRILYCEPGEILTVKFARMIKAALEFNRQGAKNAKV